jgi:hypothetical protein
VVSVEKIFLKSLQTDDGRQVMAIAHTAELKKGNNSKMGNGIYFKIAG